MPVRSFRFLGFDNVSSLGAPGIIYDAFANTISIDTLVSLPSSVCVSCFCHKDAATPFEPSEASMFVVVSLSWPPNFCCCLIVLHAARTALLQIEQEAGQRVAAHATLRSCVLNVFSQKLKQQKVANPRRLKYASLHFNAHCCVVAGED